MEIKKILILNLLCLNIYSADLPEHEKKTLIEATQKDYENLTKIVDELDKPQLQTFDENSIKIPIELIKPGTEFYLDQKPECKALIP